MLRFVEIETPDEEQFRSAEIVDLAVAEGDLVSAGDPLFTVSKNGQSYPLPSPYDGRVAELIAHAGDRITTRTPLLLLETEVQDDDTVGNAPANSETGNDNETLESPEQEEGSNTPSDTQEHQQMLDLKEADTMSSIEIKVPDIGGSEDVEVIEVLVSVGDTVAVDDPLITLETDKASMDVPSPQAGEIADIVVATGDKVSEGSVIVKLKDESAQADEPAETDAPAEKAAEPEAEPEPAQEPVAPAPAPAAESTGSQITVNVPDIGGEDQVDVIEILVNVGDTVKTEDSLITLESDKATMDVPSSADGVVTEILISVGDKVAEGSAIVVLASDSGAATASEPAPAEPVAEAAPPEPAPAPAPAAQSGGQDITVEVPDIGGEEDIPVIEVLVKEGDTVSVEDGLVTLESDKATMDVPSSAAGVVKEVLVDVGDKVSMGSAVVVLSNQDGAAADAPASEPAAAPSPAPAPAPSPSPAPVASAPTPPEAPSTGDAPHASPSVRRFARELGVDVEQVQGSGSKGRITKEDVQQFVKGVVSGAATAAPAASSGGAAIEPIPAVDFSQFGETEVAPLTKIKRLTGENLHRSWLNIPHVTYNDDIDITELEKFRKEMKAELAEQGIKITPLAFQMKALASALKAFPNFNSSLEPGGENLILKKYFNIGVAVDTPAGLMVPVVKNVDKKGIVDLGQEVGELAKAARERKLKPVDMQGGCITISSLGGIGGTSFTPIVNPPEVAILGVTRAQMKPTWNGSEFVPRQMMPVSLSFDHRVIDGAEAARFVNHVAAKLSDIRRLML